MLSEIQSRDGELVKHRTQLEQLVKERTTDLQLRTTDLAHSNAELARRNSELDEFAYVASHDLRSPLRAIDNLATWIAEDDETTFSEQSRDDIEKLRGRVRRMEALLDGLLKYSRIGSKKYEAEEVETGEMVREIADLLDRPEDFHIEIANDMPTLQSPRVPLESVYCPSSFLPTSIIDTEPCQTSRTSAFCWSTTQRTYSNLRPPIRGKRSPTRSTSLSADDRPVSTRFSQEALAR